jgi:hypothetical protein
MVEKLPLVYLQRGLCCNSKEVGFRPDSRYIDLLVLPGIVLEWNAHGLGCCQTPFDPYWNILGLELRVV